jgi:hypothetical protein
MFKQMLSVYAALGDEEMGRRTLMAMEAQRHRFDVDVCLEMAELFLRAKVSVGRWASVYCLSM